VTTVARFLQTPGSSFFLFGPRGTGKSTWLHACLPDASVVDLLDPDTFRTFSSRPERLIALVEGSRGVKQVVVDEIQKAPHLLDVVHLLIERGAGTQFVLTGSSARKLRRAGVDLLAGRALLKTMHPFMAAELGSTFTLGRALRYGMLPLVVTAEVPDSALSAYAGLYLREEVQVEGIVRNIGSFARFLETMSLSHGSVLSTSAVARDCQVSRTTVEGYMAVLEDLLLGFRLPVFTRRARRHLAQHPKFYYFDAGVFRSLRPTGPMDAGPELEGAALEGLVAQHLRAWIAYGNETHTLHYWRTKSGSEVDFVVYGPRAFVAIEVKNGRSVHDRDVAQLRAFRADYPEAEVCLLYRGTHRLRIRDVPCVPVDEFLSGVRPERSLSPE
jgi:predicted AAA+ superfamily ATPase